MNLRDNLYSTQKVTVSHTVAQKGHSISQFVEVAFCTCILSTLHFGKLGIFLLEFFSFANLYFCKNAKLTSLQNLPSGYFYPDFIATCELLLGM